MPTDNIRELLNPKVLEYIDSIYKKVCNDHNLPQSPISQAPEAALRAFVRNQVTVNSNTYSSDIQYVNYLNSAFRMVRKDSMKDRFRKFAAWLHGNATNYCPPNGGGSGGGGGGIKPVVQPEVVKKPEAPSPKPPARPDPVKDGPRPIQRRDILLTPRDSSGPMANRPAGGGKGGADVNAAAPGLKPVGPVGPARPVGPVRPVPPVGPVEPVEPVYWFATQPLGREDNPPLVAPGSPFPPPPPPSAKPPGQVVQAPPGPGYRQKTWSSPRPQAPVPAPPADESPSPAPPAAPRTGLDPKTAKTAAIALGAGVAVGGVGVVAHLGFWAKVGVAARAALALVTAPAAAALMVSVEPKSDI